MAAIKQTWPTRNDLLTWFIYHKLQTSPVEDFDNPDQIRSWVQDFNKISMHDLHQRLYVTYSEYRVEHVNPYYMSHVDWNSSGQNNSSK